MKHNEIADCFACGKEQISYNEIGLNKKMLGRSIKKFYCLDCLSDYLEITSQELLDKVDEFKSQGCTLFK